MVSCINEAMWQLGPERKKKERKINAFITGEVDVLFLNSFFKWKKNLLIWGKCDSVMADAMVGVTRGRFQIRLKTHLPFYICPM